MWMLIIILYFKIVPRLAADGHKVAIMANYGFAGSTMEWRPGIPVAVLMAGDRGRVYAAAIGAGRRAADTARAFRHGAAGRLVAGVPDALGDGEASEDRAVGPAVAAG